MSSSCGSHDSDYREQLKAVLQWFRPGVDTGFFGTMEPMDDMAVLNAKYGSGFETASMEELQERVKQLLEVSDGQLIDIRCVPAEIVSPDNSGDEQESTLGKDEGKEDDKATAEKAFSGLCGVLAKGCYYEESLRRISLNGQRVTESLLQELGAALNRAGNPVTSLQLSMTGIADGGSRIIAGWLRSEECSLQELDLSLNEMSEAGMLEIAEALSSESSKLLALNLSLQKSDSGASVKTLEAFTKSLESNTHLSLLSLHMNSIPGYGTEEEEDEDSEEVIKGRVLRAVLNEGIARNRVLTGAFAESSDEEGAEGAGVGGASDSEDDEYSEVDSDDFQQLVEKLQKRQRRH